MLLFYGGCGRFSASLEIAVVDISYFCTQTTLIMTTLEKKQKLIDKIQELPDHFIDEANNALDAILEKEQQRKETFDRLLDETSEHYKAVWKALA